MRTEQNFARITSHRRPPQRGERAVLNCNARFNARPERNPLPAARLFINPDLPRVIECNAFTRKLDQRIKELGEPRKVIRTDSESLSIRLKRKLALVIGALIVDVGSLLATAGAAGATGVEKQAPDQSCLNITHVVKIMKHLDATIDRHLVVGPGQSQWNITDLVLHMNQLGAAKCAAGFLDGPEHNGGQSISPETPAEIPDVLIENVPWKRQGKNECGEYALGNLLAYYGVESDVSDVISASKTISPTAGGFDPTLTKNPIATSPDALVQIARKYGMQVDAREGRGFDWLTEQLKQKKPVLVDILANETGSTFGHFILVVGINKKNGTVVTVDSNQARGYTEIPIKSFMTRWAGGKKGVDVKDPVQKLGHSEWAMVISK